MTSSPLFRFVIFSLLLTVFVTAKISLVFAQSISAEEVLTAAKKQLERDSIHQTITGTYLWRKHNPRTEQQRKKLEEYQRKMWQERVESTRNLHAENAKKGIHYDIEKVIRDDEAFHRAYVYKESALETTTALERFYYERNNKRRCEIMWLFDTDPSVSLQQIKNDILSRPESIIGRVQMDRSSDGYELGGTIVHDVYFPMPACKGTAKSFLDETLMQEIRISQLGAIIKDEVHEIPVLTLGRDLMPLNIVNQFPRDKVPLTLRREIRQDGDELYIIMFGNPNHSPTYFEQRLLPKKGYVVTYSCLKINGSIIREDVFENYHQIEKGVWVPFYSKARARIKAGNTDDCFSYTEYLALSAPKICESLPEELFAIEINDIEKHVIAKQGYYQIGGQIAPEILKDYRQANTMEQRPLRRMLNSFLFWAGTGLVLFGAFIMFMRLFQKKRE